MAGRVIVPAHNGQSPPSTRNNDDFPLQSGGRGLGKTTKKGRGKRREGGRYLPLGPLTRTFLPFDTEKLRSFARITPIV